VSTKRQRASVTSASLREIIHAGSLTAEQRRALLDLLDQVARGIRIVELSERSDDPELRRDARADCWDHTATQFARLLDTIEQQRGATSGPDSTAPKLVNGIEKICSKLSDGKLAYSVDEVCSMLSIGRSVVFELLRRKEIASVKVERRRLIPAAALEMYVSQLVADIQ
jgi:excisionase family DNA binding protein